MVPASRPPKRSGFILSRNHAVKNLKLDRMNRIYRMTKQIGAREQGSLCGHRSLSGLPSCKSCLNFSCSHLPLHGYGLANIIPLFDANAIGAIQYSCMSATRKAALTRAHSKTCRSLGGFPCARSVLQCGTQFRFGPATALVQRLKSFRLKPKRMGVIKSG